MLILLLKCVLGFVDQYLKRELENKIDEKGVNKNKQTNINPDSHTCGVCAFSELLLSQREGSGLKLCIVHKQKTFMTSQNIFITHVVLSTFRSN